MKISKITFLLVLLQFVKLSAQSNINFDNYFEDRTLRIDYYHIGCSNIDSIAIQNVTSFNEWAGSKSNLIYPLELGHFQLAVFDVESGDLIFSKNYDSIFYEYCLSQAAKDGKMESFEEVQLIPFPKETIKLEFRKRDKQNKFVTVHEEMIEPDKISATSLRKDEVLILNTAAENDNAFDFTILAEGYTSNEREKFLSDSKKYVELFFQHEPYKSSKDKINIRAIFTSSEESGVDDPVNNELKNTMFGATFNGLGDPYYLIIEDIFSVHDVLSQVPTDVFLIVCNTDKFAGNGIFNYFSLVTLSGQGDEYVLIHELGHYIGGLADEYYQTTNFATGEIYPKEVEPVEPNITTLTNPQNVRWKEYLTENIEVPTEWGKIYFDSLWNVSGTLRKEMLGKIAELKENNATDEEITNIKTHYRSIAKQVRKEAMTFLNEHELIDATGVFEGGGHTSEGIYRPSLNSVMAMFGKDYNSVSEVVIRKILEYYTN